METMQPCPYRCARKARSASMWMPSTTGRLIVPASQKYLAHRCFFIEYFAGDGDSALQLHGDARFFGIIANGSEAETLIERMGVVCGQYDPSHRCECRIIQDCLDNPFAQAFAPMDRKNVHIAHPCETSVIRHHARKACLLTLRRIKAISARIFDACPEFFLRHIARPIG